MFSAIPFQRGSIKNNIVKGHAYIAFESLAEADGFQFFTTNADGVLSGIMGDVVPVDSVKAIKAVSPLPVQFQLSVTEKSLVN